MFTCIHIFSINFRSIEQTQLETSPSLLYGTYTQHYKSCIFVPLTINLHRIARDKVCARILYIIIMTDMITITFHFASQVFIQVRLKLIRIRYVDDRLWSSELRYLASSTPLLRFLFRSTLVSHLTNKMIYAKVVLHK